MKNVKIWIVSAIVSASLFLSACSEIPASESTGSSPAASYGTESQEGTIQDERPSDSAQIPYQEPPAENLNKTAPADDQQAVSALSQNTFSADEIAPYSGQPYVAVNNNVPYFSQDDLTAESFEFYSELDDLGRCGAAPVLTGN